MEDDMDIWVAYIGIAGSFAVALFSLLTSGKAKELALRAEVEAKKGEQVRLKGLEAAETLLSAAADLHLALVAIRDEAMNHGGMIPKDSTAMQVFVDCTRHMSHVRVRYAMYWTGGIRRNIDKLLDDVLALGYASGDFRSIETQFEELTDMIVDLCKTSYL